MAGSIAIILRHRSLAKIILLFCMEAWFNTLDIPSLNGSFAKLQNLYSLNCGIPTTWKAHLTVSVSWTAAETTKKYLQTRFFTQINLPQGITFGATKVYKHWQTLLQKAEGLWWLLGRTISIALISRTKTCWDTRRIGSSCLQKTRPKIHFATTSSSIQKQEILFCSTAGRSTATQCLSFQCSESVPTSAWSRVTMCQRRPNN